MPTRNVSVRDPERAAIERRRLWSERLMAQSQQGAPQEWNGMRIVPTYGIGQGLTQLGQALLGSKIDRDVSQQETALDEQERQAMAARLQGLVPRQPIQPGQPGSGVLRPGQPAPFSSQQQAAMQSIGALPIEQQEQILGQASMGQLFPQPQEGFTLGQNDQRYDAQGRLIASGPRSAAAAPDLPEGMQMGPNGPEWIPGYVEAQERMRRSGASKINIGAAEEQRRDNELQAATTATQDIDRVLSMMESGTLPDVGVGEMLSGVYGTDAKNIAALLQTIKGGVSVQQLQQMRQASPTGGALGNVTEKELAMLQALEGSLDQGQGKEQLTDNLNRLWNARMDVIHGPGNGPPRRPLAFEQTATSGPQIGAVEDGYRFKGGDPSKPESWEKVQ